MRFTFSKFILILLLLSFYDCLIFAQKEEKPNGKPIKSRDENEVRINLLITDENGLPIDDIKIEDLKLFEKGVEQRIINIEKKLPLNLGLVVDNTGSMKTRIKEVAQTGALVSRNLYENDESFVVRFVNSEKIEVLQEWTKNKTLLEKSFSELFIEGGQSAVIDAVYLSVEKMLVREKADRSKRYAVILISDGEDRDSFYKINDVLNLLEGSSIQIFAVVVSDIQNPLKYDRSKDLIKKLIFATEGAAYYPAKPKKNEKIGSEIIDAVKAVVLELRSQYVVSYKPTSGQLYEEKRELKFIVADGKKGEKRIATLRPSFRLLKNSYLSKNFCIQISKLRSWKTCKL